MKKNENGFGVIGILALVVIIGLIGAVGWFVYDRQSNKTQNKDTATQTNQQEGTKTPVSDASKTDPYADWEIANFELIEGSFKYPKSLKLEHELNPSATPNTGLETFTLTAEDDTYISLIAFHFQGGFSGDEPKYLIEDVVTGTDKTNNREFSSIIYKNSNNVYDTIYVVDSTETEYKAGEEKQIFINSFSVQPKGANTGKSQLSIRISGQKYQTYETLDKIKSMSAFNDIDKFLNALNLPKAN